MGANIEPLRPAQIVARRVRAARESRRWTQADLARELSELGYEKSRSTVTKLEGGQYRNVSVDDVFAFAAALGIAPVYLLTPLEDDAPVMVTSRVQLPAWSARGWIKGRGTPPMLPGVDFRQIPESELVADIVRWLARGMAPVAYALSEDLLVERARRMAADLRNPQPEGAPDGNRE